MEISRKPFIWGMIVGLFISVFLGGCIAVVAAKAGITPAVSPLVVLTGWMIFSKMFPDDFKGFLSSMQVTGSAGNTVAAGVVFSAPIAQVLTSEITGTPVDINLPQLIIASLSGSFMGWGFVGLATPRLLADPRLPAPEAVACDRLIQTAISDPKKRPNIKVSLIPGVLLGILSSLLVHFKILAAKIFSPTILGASFPIYLSPIYIGIGALVTFETAILLFAGGVLNSSIKAVSTAQGLPGETFRWVGGAAMLVSVIYSLVSYFLDQKKKKTPMEEKNQQVNLELLKVKKNEEMMSKMGIAIGAALFILLMFMLKVTIGQVIVLSLVGVGLGHVLSNLGGLLSLQVGSSASPVSGTVFVGLLVFSIVALLVGLTGLQGALTLVPLTVCILVAICAANDSSQDYKTVYLNGFRVSQSFICQLVGLIGGAITIPVILSVIHKTQVLGSPELPIPQASFFATVLKSLFIETEIPLKPVFAGLILGVFAVLLEMWGKKRKMILSSIALTVGIYLPAAIGIGAMIGQLAKILGSRDLKGNSNQGILITAGFITGDAFFSLVISFFILFGFSGGVASSPLHWSASLVALLMVLFGIYYNYKQKD